MREIMKYIENLHKTIRAQNKGIRRLVRKNKRLQAELEEAQMALSTELRARAAWEVR